MSMVLALAGACAPSQPTVPEVTSTTTTASEPTASIVVATGVPRLWVDEVTGAPGDGNERLSVEIIRQMQAVELLFARFPGEADYFVTADVDVYAIDTQTEIAEIIWRMTDRHGTEIGQIKQQNPIPRGMLHETWGETAVAAANGGLQGVVAILDSLGHARPQTSQ